MSIPKLADRLPHLMSFVARLAADFQTGSLADWGQFRAACADFYTPAMMASIEAVAPGWQKMASYADQQTLIHVTSVLAGLFLLPEYHAANAHQQSLIEWIVLWHDIDKEARHGKADPTHGFRSAAITGAGLPALGFDVSPVYAEEFRTWYHTTHGARVYSEALQADIQDNQRLPEIIAGINRLFSPNAALIVKGVLLHMSINVVRAWPQAAPLPDDEIQQYVTPELFPLLRVMMLVDNVAWAFFEPQQQADDVQQTRTVFQRIGLLLNGDV